MTKIIAEWKNHYFRMTIQGHVKYGEIGNNIICSAVSTLVQTLEFSMKKYKSMKCLEKCIIKEKDGYLLVSVRPKDKYMLEVATVFDTVQFGLSLLANQYPDYISLEVKEPTLEELKH
jgi:uncharacterized protein YsxB (DUF464 family)